MPAPTPGTIVDGFRFKGGNPNDKASWEDPTQDWGAGARFLPNGDVVRIGPKGGFDKLGKAPPMGGATGARRVPDDEFRRYADTVSAIDDAEQRTGFWNTGLVGKATQDWGGSPAFNLDKDLDTIRARTAFSELQNMRNNSPTGGALGAIAVQELQMLQATEGNLDVGQGAGQIDRNLGRMRTSLTERVPGLTQDRPIDLSGGESRATIPRKAYYRDPQGNIRRNDNGDAGNPIMPRSVAQAAAKLPAPARSAYRSMFSAGEIDTTKPRGTQENPYLARSTQTYQRLPAGSWVILPNGDFGQKER